MKLLEKLKEAQNNKQALLAANFYNYETCKGIVQAARKLNSPIILQLTPGSIEYMGLKTALAIARTVSTEKNIKAWIHLDHCNNIELIKSCLDTGFDSIMIDASDHQLEENISITRQVVKLAALYHVNIEAELGYIPKPNSEIDKNINLLIPQDAKRSSGRGSGGNRPLALSSRREAPLSAPPCSQRPRWDGPVTPGNR